MKYYSKRSLAIGVIILIAVIGVFAFSMQYRNKDINNNIVLTTAIKNVDGAKGQERILIAENKEGDYQIYYDYETVYLTHKGVDKEFKGWLASVEEKTPEMFYKDYDGDGEKELLVKLVSGVDQDIYNVKTYVYSMFLFKAVDDEDGTFHYESIGATADTWRKPFESVIRSELTQLDSCKKFLQFVMDDIDTPLTYDSKTGISENKHVSFVSALTDSKKNYYTLSTWSRGKGIYELDEEGNISLDIEILANYEEVDSTQTIGDVHCDIDVIDGEFAIVPKSIYFEPREGFMVSDPRESTDEKWSYKIKNNSATPTLESNEIDWIDASLELQSGVDEVAAYFGEMSSKVKAVDSIEFTQNAVILTAKSGYTFLERVVNNGVFSVTIKDGEKEYDISYKASISEKDGKSILTITLDKNYPRETITTAKIKFGV
ncbi:MAG: hypothetical protein ACI4IQ_06025 [Eubacterium sp.]